MASIGPMGLAAMAISRATACFPVRQELAEMRRLHAEEVKHSLGTIEHGHRNGGVHKWGYPKMEGFC